MINLVVCNLLLICLSLSGCKVSKGNSEVKTGVSSSRPTTPTADTIMAWDNLPQIKTSSFIGTDTAWFVTNKSMELWHTADGGAHWQKATGPPPPDSSIKGIGFNAATFIDTHLGWAVSDYLAQVWRTTDGGQSWAEVARLKTENKDPTFVGVVDVKFTNDLHGWMIDAFNIWRTVDGGVSWKRGTYSSEREGQPERIFFLNDYRGWATGSHGELYDTKDGGQTWHVRKLKSDSTLTNRDVFFADERTGWLSGYLSGQLSKTDNEGNTWRQVKVGDARTQISSIYFINKEEGWAVGYTQQEANSAPRAGVGIVLHTTDGGLTWTSIQVGEKNPFYSRVYFADAQHGWIIARDNVYRSEDGGQTWLLVLRLPPI